MTSDPKNEPPSIAGQCVEAGDDNDGNARLTIIVLRADLKKFPGNLLFKRVSVTLENQP